MQLDHVDPRLDTVIQELSRAQREIEALQKDVKEKEAKLEKEKKRNTKNVSASGQSDSRWRMRDVVTSEICVYL